jgi:hypothetical protein
LIVASERQTEANRRNAGSSAGPRSVAGKKRAAHNAYRHGLSLSLGSSAAVARQVDKLSRKIAGNAKSEIVLRYARDAAEAELELERIRKVKVALVERVLVFGALGPTVRFGPVTKALRHLKLVIAGKAMLGEPIDPLATLPSEEPERSAEAMRRAVPDLIRLDRYEGRAVRRRDHATKRTVNNRLSK